jgi:hypothetical protein
MMVVKKEEREKVAFSLFIARLPITDVIGKVVKQKKML